MKQTAPHKMPRYFALLVSFVLLPSSLFAEETTPSALLEKGIYTEETVGDLAEAIQIYQRVVSTGKESTRAAAQAQYRIGACYEKQGKAEKAS